MTTRNSHFDSVCIKSTGSYVPSRILTNEEVVANTQCLRMLSFHLAV